MAESGQLPTWAPRVPQHLIRRLYESDAQGIYDDDLLDEVGWALRARCESFIAAVWAVRGRAPCPACGEVVLHHGQPDEVLRCACGWQLPWRDYFATIQHKQLSGADPVLALFREFVAAFPSATTSRQKMLLIDRLIHGFHYHLATGATRAVAVNLLEGRLHEVMSFLDSLSYGDSSSPGLRETRQTWRQTIDATAERWKDRRLRRERE